MVSLVKWAARLLKPSVRDVEKPTPPFKPKTGFKNGSGEDLAEYLSKYEVATLNDAVDCNGTLVGKIKSISDDGRVYKGVFEGPVIELKNELRRAGVGLEDARAITSVVARWAIGVKR